ARAALAAADDASARRAVAPVRETPTPVARPIEPAPAETPVPRSAPEPMRAAVAAPVVREAASIATPALRSLDAEQWLDLVADLPLRGPVRELAASAAFVALDGAVLRLALPESDEHLKAPIMVHQLCEALAGPLGAAPQIRFEVAAAHVATTLHERNARERDARQSNAEDRFLSDPDVQRLMSQQGAKLVPDSIRPYE
ncbi:MAG: DNA polymerase III subunit gamma/tau C-terminal domain-containing protein, partial [Luteimonas sp.]